MKKEETVKLISAEGFEFVVSKEAAMISTIIRNMITSPGAFSETQHGEVTFPEISAPVLEKICQYFHWSLQFASKSVLLMIGRRIDDQENSGEEAVRKQQAQLKQLCRRSNTNISGIVHFHQRGASYGIKCECFRLDTFRTGLISKTDDRSRSHNGRTRS